MQDRNNHYFKDKGLDRDNDMCLIRPMSTDALKRAIDKAGGQTDLARAIGTTQGHVSQWLRRGKVPADKVLLIERATGVPRQELRPDVFEAA